jgi:hypothetical protein
METSKERVAREQKKWAERTAAAAARFMEA